VRIDITTLLDDGSIDIAGIWPSESAKEDARINSVTRDSAIESKLKALTAAFISICEDLDVNSNIEGIDTSIETEEAKKLMRSACMWAISGATKKL
jgi:hypothetical protein